jgi:hypothetical protein
MMNLQDFVAESLRQIIRGVKAVQEEARQDKAWVNPPIVWPDDVRSTRLRNLRNSSLVHEIEFDVAVTVSQEDGKKGGAGLVIGPVVLGAQGQSASTSESVSRVKFSVPVSYPMVVLKEGD